MVTMEPEELVGRAGGVDTYRLRWSSDLVDPEYVIWNNGALMFDEPYMRDELLVTVPAGGQVLIEVRDDGVVPEPVFSGVIVIGWTAARDAQRYRVEIDGGVVSTIAADGRGWYEFQTDVLPDVTDTGIEVIAERLNGEAAVPCEWVVPMGRHPDVPVATESYDELTGLLTFS